MATTSIIPDNVATKKNQQVQPYAQPQQAGTVATVQPYQQLPYMQQNYTNQQIVPLSSDAVAKGNQQVVQRAQSTAMAQQPTSQLSQQVSQRTGELLRDPDQGFDTAGYKKNVMDQFNIQQAQATEAARQGLGATSQSGELSNEFLKNVLYGAQQRANLGTQVDYDLAALKRENLLNAIATGRAGVESERAGVTGYINNLATAAGMAEPELQRTYQTGERLSTQDYTAQQADLDRILQKAIADQDVEAQKWAINRQGELDLLMQTNDMNHDERMAFLQDQYTNALADNDVERQKIIMGYAAQIKAKQDDAAMAFEREQNNLDRVLERAIADQDDATQRWVVERQGELDLKRQTNGMNHETAMAYLNSELENATADNDIDRQKVILGYSAKLTAEQDEKKFGYETALTNLKGEIDKAISAGDNTSAEAMQKAELEYRVNRDIQDFALQQAALDLEEKGVDMTVVENQYNQILNTFGEGAANEFIAATLKEQGVDTSKYQIADKQQQAMAALASEMELTKYQFMQSHPEYVVNRYAGGTEASEPQLTAEGLQKFNEYFNYTMYGELTPEQQEEKRTAGYLRADDIPFAQEGDKVKIDEPYTFTVSQSGSSGNNKAAGVVAGILTGGVGFASLKGQDEAMGDTTVTIPAGEYAVVEEVSGSGSKFWGTARETTNKYLVDAQGNKYMIGSNRGTTSGNIVSNLWAGK